MMRKLWAGLIIAGLIAAGCSSSSDDLESKANDIMKSLYGPCFKPIYSGNLADASVVETASATEGVVTVKVFLTSIATGRDTTYQFRVNTGTGDYKGVPRPGSGIPTNAAAGRLVADC